QFFFSSRRRHTRWPRDWSSDVCSSDLTGGITPVAGMPDIPRSFVSLPAVMYQPGKVLSLGMGTKATVIDFNPATPTWKATAPPEIGRASCRERGHTSERAECGHDSRVR